MGSPQRRVTALDVARLAGVSKTTVSYVLNDTPHQTIPEETRVRVLGAARTLSYIPSSAARALRLGRSDTVLLLMPDWPLGRVLTSIIEGLTEELEPHGLALITRRRRRGMPLTSMWRELVPAAVIAIGAVGDDEQDDMRQAGIFVITALLSSPASPHASVVFPQELIGALQVQHLAARGHRRLAYVAPAEERLREFRDLRLDGARRACLELGLDEPLLIETTCTLDAAIAAVRHLTDQSAQVTAVAAYNDEFGVALLAGLRERGLRAPDDLAVIGVDNEPLGQFTAPPLTTIDLNQELVAAHIARLVVHGIAGREPPVPPRSDAIELVIRGSA